MEVVACWTWKIVKLSEEVLGDKETNSNKIVSRCEAKNKETFGKCNSLHGHNYKVEFSFSGYIDQGTGMVVNISDLKVILQVSCASAPEGGWGQSITSSSARFGRNLVQSSKGWL